MQKVLIILALMSCSNCAVKEKVILETCQTIIRNNPSDETIEALSNGSDIMRSDLWKILRNDSVWETNCVGD